jgi:hypothetical protein
MYMHLLTLDFALAAPRKGRKKALRLGQIGIGCLYCNESTAGASLIESSRLVSQYPYILYIFINDRFPFCQSTNSKDPRKFTQRHLNIQQHISLNLS